MKIKEIAVIFIALVCFATVASAQTRQDTIDDHKAAIEQFRAEKDARFSDPATSPLTAAQLQPYDGLNYFTVDYVYKLSATFIPANNPQRERLKLSDGGTVRLFNYGKVIFTLDGTEYTLSVFKNSDLPEFTGNPEQLFIPFKDATSGESTNGNGRYIMVNAPQNGNQVTLDFNLALNPYGGYSDGIPSVLPPPGNNMAVPLPTGERKYDDR
jgi:hypothetical protein